MRPISNVVDVTNYVMLALGSPLHAFDYDSLAGGRIVVRRARPGETLETLDGSQRELVPDDLVIADAERPIAIAGVMGGANTEVSDATTSVLLEAANFEPLTVLRSGERLRMRTESQTRWEKGVDAGARGRGSDLRDGAPGGARRGALDRARRGTRRSGRAAVDRLRSVAHRPRDRPTRFREPEQRDRLERLGFGVAADWTVQTPSWRARDVRRDIDLVEEVARFRLEDVPATLPVRQAMFGRLTHDQRLRRQVEDVLVGAGLYEAYTYSLQPDDPDPSAIVLPVPLSSQQRVLRTTLRLGLLDAARHNVADRQRRRRLFEVAHVYLPAEPRARRALACRRHRARRASRSRRASSSGSSSRCTSSRASRLRDRSRKRPSARRCSRAGSRSTRRSTSTASGVRSSSTSRELFALVPERILYRDVITYPPLRLDLAFVVDEQRAGRRAARRRARRGGRRAARGAVPERLPRRPDPGRQEVGRARLRVPVAERTLSDEDGARLRDAIVRALAKRVRRRAARLASRARARRSARRRRGSPRRCSSARASGSRRPRACRTSSSSCRRTSRRG